MNLLPTSDQQAIADTAAAFLHKELHIATGKIERTFDPTTWQRSAELGWLALGLDDTLGGIGATLAEETLLHRELGRHLAPGPYATTTIAAHVAAHAGNTDLATALTTGEIRCGITLTTNNNTTTDNNNDGALAIDTEPGHLALDIDHTGARLHHITTHTPIDTVDHCSTLATITLGDPIATTTGRHPLDRGRVLIAAQLLGIAEACRDMSATYAATRTQFGKPIGSFQAVKHRCSDMVARCETTRSLTYMAALLVDDNRPDAALHAASALVHAVTAATRNASANIQNHGGIGFTTELGADRYATRTLTLRHLFGNPHNHHADIITAGPTRFT